MIKPQRQRGTFLTQLGLAIACLGIALGLIPHSLGETSAGSHPLPRARPESQGVASSNVLSFLEAVEAGRLNLHSLMVVRHGRVVVEGWWAPYAPEWRHTLYSLSKSFTSTAVGLAASEAKLRLDDRVVTFFPDQLPAQVSPNLAAMKVKDLLMMGSGHSGDSLFGPGFSLTNRTLDWARSVLSRPVDHLPGTHFAYNNGASYLLSAIVQKATGQTVLDYLTPRLFKPLGIEGADWEQSPQGINSGGFGLRVRTEDIAKLGQLYLRKGTWNGRRILPASWVQEATGLRIQNAPPDDPKKAQTSDWAQGYGYQFWRCRHNAFRGDGAAGQYCIVLPDQNAVIAITAETGDMQAVLNTIWENLLPGFGPRPLASDPRIRARLEQRLKLLMLPLPAGQLESPEAARVGDRVYHMTDNPLGIRTVAAHFSARDCVVTLQDAQGEHSVRSGLGSWITGETRLSPARLHLATTASFGKSPIAAGAAWKDPHTLVMDWRFVETAHYQRVICHFDGDNLRCEFKRGSSLLNPSNQEDGLVLRGSWIEPKK